MRKFGKPGFKGIGTASGAAMGRIAVKIFECNGCSRQYRAEKPVQCGTCGRLDFSKIDSIAEANRLGELRLLLGAGIISELRTQVHFSLMAHRADGVGVKVGEYWADAVYIEDGKQVIEDTKGAITDLAKWKLRHMAAQGLPVTIVTAKGKHRG